MFKMFSELFVTLLLEIKTPLVLNPKPVRKSVANYYKLNTVVDQASISRKRKISITQSLSKILKTLGCHFFQIRFLESN